MQISLSLAEVESCVLQAETHNITVRYASVYPSMHICIGFCSYTSVLILTLFSGSFKALRQNVAIH